MLQLSRRIRGLNLSTGSQGQRLLRIKSVEILYGISWAKHRNQSTADGIVEKIAAKQPFKVELVKGKRYSWCKCGFSNNQPFCDGQHRKQAPGVSPSRFKAEETATVFLCGCKQTANPPYCDGTHLTETVQKASVV